MYDWPEVAWATDALWRAIAERLNHAGIAAPAALDRLRQAEAIWRDPGLVLSQVCGFPVAASLRGAVQLIATPIYGVEGCRGPCYSSFIVARRDDRGRALADFAGLRFAFNVPDSLSGSVALVAAMREEGLAPGSVEWIETGGHRASILAVAEGRADLAAIDAVAWALAERFEPEPAAKLQMLMQTPLRPAPPTITGAGRSTEELEAIRAAFTDALASEETGEARGALRIEGAAVLTASDYEPLAALVR